MFDDTINDLVTLLYMLIKIRDASLLESETFCIFCSPMQGRSP